MALNFPADPTDGQVYEGFKYSLATDAWLPVSNIQPIASTGKFNMDVYTNGQDILLDAERVLFGTVTGITTSGSNTLYYTNGSTSPLAMAKFSVSEGSLYFRMDGGSAQGTAFETNLGLMGSGNSIVVDTEGGPYTVVLTSGFTYSEGGYYNATTSWPDGQGFTVFSGGSDTYTLSSTSYVFTTDNSGLGTTHPAGTYFYMGGHVIKTADASFSGSSVTLGSNPGVVVGDTVYDYGANVLGGITGPEYDHRGVTMSPQILPSDGLFRVEIPESYYDWDSGKVVPKPANSPDYSPFVAASGVFTTPQNRKQYVANVIADADAFNSAIVDEMGPDFVQVSKSATPYSNPGIRSYSLQPKYDSTYDFSGTEVIGRRSISLDFSNSPVSGENSVRLGGQGTIGNWGTGSTLINSYGSIYSGGVTAIGNGPTAWRGRVPVNSTISGDSQTREIKWIDSFSVSSSGTASSDEGLVNYGYNAFFPTISNSTALTNVCTITSKFVYINTSGQVVSGKVELIIKATATLATIVSGPTVTYDKKDLVNATASVNLGNYSIIQNPSGYQYEQYYYYGFSGLTANQGRITWSHTVLESILSTRLSSMAR